MPPSRTRPARPILEVGSSCADGDLLDRLRAGDAEAFTEVVDGWSPMMLRVARTFVSTQASAEEIVQETWLQMIRGLDGFEGRSSLRTWVFRILSNQAKTRGIREARSVPWSSIAADDKHPTTTPDVSGGSETGWNGQWRLGAGSNREYVSPASCVIAGETRQLVSAAIHDLPQRQQRVIRLRDIEGRSAGDVCADLGISAGNQRVLLHRARAGLRLALAEYYRQD